MLKMEAIPLIYVQGNAVLFLYEFRFMNSLSSLPQHMHIILMFFWYISLCVLHFSYFHLFTPWIIFSLPTKILEGIKAHLAYKVCGICLPPFLCMFLWIFRNGLRQGSGSPRLCQTWMVVLDHRGRYSACNWWLIIEFTNYLLFSCLIN